MIREWLTDQGLALGPAFALLLFLVLFVGIFFWIYRPGSTRYYAEHARLPLGGEDAPGSQGNTRKVSKDRKESHGK